MIKKFLVILLVISCIFVNVCVVYAGKEDQEADYHNIYDVVGGKDSSGLVNAGLYITKWIRYGAFIASVVVLMSKGIKFIVASPEGKADVKKEMIPWAVGMFLLLAFNVILNVVANFAQPHVNNITL